MRLLGDINFEWRPDMSSSSPRMTSISTCASDLPDLSGRVTMVSSSPGATCARPTSWPEIVMVTPGRLR